MPCVKFSGSMYTSSRGEGRPAGLCVPGQRGTWQVHAYARAAGIKYPKRSALEQHTLLFYNPGS